MSGGSRKFNIITILKDSVTNNYVVANLRDITDIYSFITDIFSYITDVLIDLFSFVIDIFRYITNIFISFVSINSVIINFNLKI